MKKRPHIKWMGLKNKYSIKGALCRITIFTHILKSWHSLQVVLVYLVYLVVNVQIYFRVLVAQLVDPQLESSYWQILLTIYCWNCTEKTKIKKKRPGCAQIFKEKSRQKRDSNRDVKIGWRVNYCPLTLPFLNGPTPASFCLFSFFSTI